MSVCTLGGPKLRRLEWLTEELLKLLEILLKMLKGYCQWQLDFGYYYVRSW